MDLVEEEDRALAARGAAVLGARQHLAHLGSARLDRRLLLERRARVDGEHARERGLAGAGRPVQDHRVRPALLDRRAQRRAALEQVLLADELPECRGTHAGGER
jgi:hypothetical protein